MDAREFGARLRRERERRGVTVDEIAEQTKVSASILSGLERGDLARWPSGIFRRAFVRSYVAAIGLDVETTLTEFLQVFPEDGSTPKPRTFGTLGGQSMRLTLGEHAHPALDARRLVAAVIDVAVVLVATAAGAWSDGAQGAAIAGVAMALVWHTVGTLLWSVSPGTRLLRQRPLAHAREAPVMAPRAAVADVDQADVESPAPTAPAVARMTEAQRKRQNRQQRRFVLHTKRQSGRDAAGR